MAMLVDKQVIADLKREWAKVKKIDPASDSYQKLIRVLNILSLAELKKLEKADINFVSSLARNRITLKEFRNKPEAQNTRNTLSNLAGKPITLYDNLKGKKIAGVAAFARPITGMGVIVTLRPTAKINDIGDILDKVEDTLGKLKNQTYSRKVVSGLDTGGNFRVEITKG